MTKQAMGERMEKLQRRGQLAKQPPPRISTSQMCQLVSNRRGEGIVRQLSLIGRQIDNADAECTDARSVNAL